MTTETRRAAVLLSTLPEELAANLMGKLSPRQIEAVSIEIATLGAINAEEQEEVIEQFSAANPRAMSGGSGGLDLATALVQKALGAEATGTLSHVRESLESVPFGFLKQADSQNLLTFLIDEHPQTIALILCHLPPSRASEIISGLPPERRLAVLHRIATMGQTSPEIVQEVEKALETRMSSIMSQRFENAGGVGNVAEILNVIDRATERNLMEGLAQEDPELVEEIRRLMFVFEDISKFSDRDVQTVLKHVESAQWAMALKGASEELKEKVLRNLSKRAATLLEEEMEYLGPVRLSAVEQMQQQIVDVVRKLEDTGDLDLHAGDEEEELVQ